MIDICVFGDSLSYGCWDLEFEGWVNRLRHFLDPTLKHLVYNLSISGATSEHIKKRFDSEAKHRTANIIIFQLGKNDATFVKPNGENMVKIKDFEKNLHELVDMAKKITNKIIFIGISKIDDTLTNPLPYNKNLYCNNKNLLTYNEKIEKVVLKNKCLFIDVWNFFDKNDFHDPLHLNSQAHKKLFLKIRDFLFENNILDKKDFE